MVGYTPQVAAAVWTGSGNSTSPIYDSWGSPEYGSDLPGKTWKLFMDTYLAGKPALPMATRQLIVGGTNLVNPPKPSTSASSSVVPTSPTSASSSAVAPVETPSPSVTGSASVPAGGAAQSP